MMASSPVIHHVGMVVSDKTVVLQLIQERLGFECIARRETNFDSKWVLKKNGVVFVVTHRKPSQSNFEYLNNYYYNNKNEQKNDDDDNSRNSSAVTSRSSSSLTSSLSSTPSLATISSQLGHGIQRRSELTTEEIDLTCLGQHFSTVANHDNGTNTVNSVNDVSFQVNNVTHATETAVAHGAKLLQPVTEAKDEHGMVKYSIVKSCVGNVQHTLVEIGDYNGVFLPGFSALSNVSTESHTEKTDSDLGTISWDHVTLCVRKSCTLDTLSWYEKCFNMKRLIVNKDEDTQKGLILDQIGLRMAAMEYWKCAEMGLALDDNASSAKFVIGESLVDTPNQVSTFLKQHGGAGIQHIGLHTDKLIESIKNLKCKKVAFMQPPKAYYSEVGKLQEITDCGESIELLEQCGILLDSEADCTQDNSDMNKYMMQAFTMPTFGNDTFFLEFLQRHGACGFGAGNITALWRAVQVYLEKQGLQ